MADGYQRVPGSVLSDRSLLAKGRAMVDRAVHRQYGVYPEQGLVAAACNRRYLPFPAARNL